jgi:phosphoenolpyruvate carboxylase
MSEKALPASPSAPANRGFEKIDRDLSLLMEAFGEAMRRTGDEALIPHLPWGTGGAPGPELCTGRLVQAYSIAFQLLNMVEENTANQLRRAHERAGGIEAWRGLFGANLREMRERGLQGPEIAAALRRVRVEPVLTAHPTESKRITVLELHRELYVTLVQRENSMWTPSELAEIDATVRSIVERLWRTGEIYLTKPSIEMERQGIEYYLTQIFPSALARMGRRLRQAWEGVGFDPDQLQGHEPQLRIGTWVGGDRDGHPFVSPAVTEATLQSFRVNALRMHKRSLEQLRNRLSLAESLQPVPGRLLDGIAAQWENLGAEAARIATRNEGEPWRQFAGMMIARLPLADAALPEEAQLATNYFTSYRFPRELAGDLRLLRSSLLAVNARQIVETEVDPVIRQVECFGFHLASLDIRQNSAFHDRALIQVCNALGLDAQGYTEWPETERVAFLSAQLRQATRRLRPNRELGEEGTATIGALAVVARHVRRYGTDGLGSLILSMTRRLSDLLVIYFLAREAGLLVEDERGQPVCPLPVVPLLETVEDLEAGAGIVEEFLAHPVTRRSLDWIKRWDGRDEAVQQVMIGYSDSNKDKGIFASQWALHEAQERIAAVGRAAGVRIRFFHGRGGTISRGAGPTDRFLEALPSGSLGGDLRITEQGEVIAQKYGNLLTATYNLELLVAGTLRYSLPTAGSKVSPGLEEVLSRLADDSAEAYQALLREEGFIDFYRQVTPIDVLERSRIGSRPARRTGTRSLSDLRAIPWVFSWSQCRFFLPGWYGVGTALHRLRASHPEDYALLCARAGTHPFLHYVLTNIEASVCSTDPAMMEAYADLIEDPALRERFMARVREELGWVRTSLTELLGAELAERRPNFANTVERRSPPLEVLHRHQIRLLREWRALPEAERGASTVLDEILLTVNAIAGGLKTTG